MTSKFLFLFSVVMTGAFSLTALLADDAPPSAESRLREALRNTMLQLRDVQNQVVTLQAAKDQGDRDNADLKAKNDALTAQITTVTKQGADDKETADKAIADLKVQVADQTGQIGRLNQALTEWKSAYTQAAQLATAKEDARAKLAVQAALLQRTVDDREFKNLALYNTGSEILTRYEKFGLGDAIGAKEPFVGLSRVKLETLVQAYKQKLLNQTVISGQPLAPENPGSPAPTRPEVRAGQQSSPVDKTPTKT